MLSSLLANVMPATASAVLGANPMAPPTLPIPPGIVPASLLTRLAERVARNREVLGLHYRSDSEAGKNVAAQILPLLVRVLDGWHRSASSTPASSQGSSGMVMIRRIHFV